MRRRLHTPRLDLEVLLVAAVLASSCQGRAPSPIVEHITNGADTDLYPGVAALMAADTLVCTATLVSPRVLLTAAHCLSAEAPPEAFFGSAPASGGKRLGIIDVHRQPSFNPLRLTDDIALALLDAPAPGVPYALPGVLLDESAIGSSLKLVGFGRTAANDQSPPRKREGFTRLATLDARELGFVPSPSQTCEGDSGGPAFATVAGIEAVVGVTSSGDAQCTQRARDMRVDVYAGTFIAPYLSATAEGAAQAGDRCWYPANCAPSAGACVTALDDPRLSFCAPACGPEGTCSEGLSCEASLCRQPVPSPGALGSPCETDIDCIDALCASRASGGPRRCARRCFTDLPNFCPTGYECLDSDGRGGGQACFGPDSAGCSYSGHAPSTSALWLISLAALLFLRRRRSL